MHCVNTTASYVLHQSDGGHILDEAANRCNHGIRPEGIPSLNWKIPDQSVSGESLQDSADQIWPTQPLFPVLFSVAIRRPIQIIKLIHSETTGRKSTPDQLRISKINIATWLVSRKLTQRAYSSCWSKYMDLKPFIPLLRTIYFGISGIGDSAVCNYHPHHQSHHV